MFEIVDEIEKDVPMARDMVATFVSRAVVDEVLPPSFLSDAVVCNLGGDVVEKAKRKLSRDHGGGLLSRSWGPGNGTLCHSIPSPSTLSYPIPFLPILFLLSIVIFVLLLPPPPPIVDIIHLLPYI